MKLVPLNNVVFSQDPKVYLKLTFINSNNVHVNKLPEWSLELHTQRQLKIIPNKTK